MNKGLCHWPVFTAVLVLHGLPWSRTDQSGRIVVLLQANPKKLLQTSVCYLNLNMCILLVSSLWINRWREWVIISMVTPEQRKHSKHSTQIIQLLTGVHKGEAWKNVKECIYTSSLWERRSDVTFRNQGQNSCMLIRSFTEVSNYAGHIGLSLVGQGWEGEEAHFGIYDLKAHFRPSHYWPNQSSQ